MTTDPKWQVLGNFAPRKPTVSPKDMGCWAKCENCSQEISKEHVLSNSILKYLKNVTVNLGDRTIPATTKSYVIRGLCTYHNTKLSPYDDEALKLFSGWKRITTDDPAGIKNPNAMRNHIDIDIDIDSIEKWMAKTMINSVIFNAFTNKSKKYAGLNSHEAAKVIFSQNSFAPPFGVYQMDIQTPLAEKRKSWSFGVHYVELHHINEGKGIDDTYFIPAFYYLCLGGIELVGFFNITQFEDKFALDTFLKPISEKLQKNGCYRHAINFAGRPETVRKDKSKSPIGSVIFVDNKDLENPITKKAKIAIRQGLNVQP